MTDTERAQLLRDAIEACANGDLERLPDLFTRDVTAWSPLILVTSLDELTEAMGAQDEAFADFQLHIDALDVVGNKGYVEFRVTARFDQPFEVGGEVIEPNGQEVLLGAALVAEFEGDRVSAFRNYFDELTLLDQLLPAG